MRGYSDYFVGLDIGTRTVRAAVCASDPGGAELALLGLGEVPSEGMNRGVVVDISAAKNAVRRAIEAAEVEAGVEVESALVGIAGSHIRSLNSTGVVAIKGPEISPSDVRRCVEAAKDNALPSDRRIIHALPQDFKVDDHLGVREPVGMSGKRLEAQVHVVSVSVNAANNVVKSVKAAGFEVEDVILDPLASAAAVLDADERQLGVCVADLGSGTTDLAVYREGALIHSRVLPLGGESLTKAISTALLTPFSEAERVKVEAGAACAHLIEPDDWMQISSVGGRASRKVDVLSVARIIEEQMSGLFEAILAELESNNLTQHLGGGVVITGGGAQMRGMAELAERVLGLPVRRGTVAGVSGLPMNVRSESLATVLGLCLFGKAQAGDPLRGARRHRMGDGDQTGLFKITKRLMDFFSGYGEA